MPQEDAKFREIELPARVDAFLQSDHELASEFEGESSLAETTPEPQFRRADRRVPVRRGALPKKAAGRLRIALVAILIFSSVAVAYGTAYRYGTRNWRFRLESSDDVNVRGLDKVSRTQVIEVLGGDIGRNVFFIPLEQRRRQLEEIPWIESATVMRLLPNRVAVEVRERTPVAFARIANRIELVDRNGVLMDLPRNTHYSFPVLVGLNDTDPLSTRSAQLRLYRRLVSDLDGGGAHYSSDLSEVDLGDPQDLKITVADSAGAVLVHIGNDQFLERFKIYLSHVGEWRQQFHKLESVDLRYDGQIVVNPDASGR